MTDTGSSFRALHQKGNPFILANAWDKGSAKMLVALGAQAIATSSAAHAFTCGKKDMGDLSRDEALAHAQDLIAAVSVPVSGDFENGFGDDPNTVAETVRLAAEIGLAGISIEDSALPASTPYAFELAVERIRAAAAAARALNGDFVLVARADGIMNGEYNLDEALKRLKAFETAGADCLYAPLPASLDDLARICAEINAPVNALVAGQYAAVPHTAFARIGVARLSLGSALARVTHRAIHDAAQAMFDTGDFNPRANGIDGATVEALFEHS